LEKRDKIETKIYEFLGVLFFQKCVFALEKIIHFKDKGKNINYHIKSNNIDELENFQKFLYFNGFIHVRNFVILFIFLIFQSIYLNPMFLIYTIPALIKNAYCVMLQRYNYIRINHVIKLKKHQIQQRNIKKMEKIQESEALSRVKKDNVEVTLEQIQNLKKFIQGTDDVYLDTQSLNLLYLLKELAECDTKEIQQASIEKSNYVLKGGK